MTKIFDHYYCNWEFEDPEPPRVQKERERVGSCDSYSSLQRIITSIFISAFLTELVAYKNILTASGIFCKS